MNVLDDQTLFYKNHTSLLSKIIFMKAKPQSTGIVHDLKQGLLKRALAQISKRQFLFKNMNVYSLAQQTNIIQEVNGQQFMNVSANYLRETDDFDSNPVDNMMSMCDMKLMPTQYSEDGISQCKSKRNQQGYLKIDSKNKQQKLIIVDLEGQERRNGQKLTRINVKNDDFIEDSRQIEVYRTIKQRQHEQRIKNMVSEQKKKAQTPINLNNQRVMYSYDSKVTKLEKAKQRQHQTISEITPNLINTNQDEIIKKRYIQMKNNKPVTEIRNKINLTQKQIDEQRQRQNKYRKNHNRTLVETATPSSVIRVNSQTHKQYEQALMVKQPGIKILIQQKQFSMDKLSHRAKVNRRLTRSQYLQIKSNQKVRQIFRNPNASLNKLQTNPQEISNRNKTIEEQTSKNDRERQNKKKFYLIPFRFDSRSQEKSKIMTYSLQGKAELLKNTKQKAFLFESLQQNKNAKKELNFVDKYNLLYVKFKGNPPRQSSDRLIQELQSQSKVLKSKPSLQTVYSKKSSITRQNRLIKKQK